MSVWGRRQLFLRFYLNTNDNILFHSLTPTCYFADSLMWIVDISQDFKNCTHCPGYKKLLGLNQIYFFFLEQQIPVSYHKLFWELMSVSESSMGQDKAKSLIFLFFFFCSCSLQISYKNTTFTFYTEEIQRK